MTQQPQPLNLDAIEARYSDHLARHSGQFLALSLAAGTGAKFLPARITTT